MPSQHKIHLLNSLKDRFGNLRKLPGSESLFVIGDEAARVYVRYSKIHGGGKTFFGLRQVDLRQLEGHNAFLCFVVDDGSAPVFVPYDAFEDVFRNSETAKDGQHKVQLLLGRHARELYIARQGRFNIEGYIGYETLSRCLDAKRLRNLPDLSHSEVQSLLVAIGCLKGYNVRVPDNDVARLHRNLTDGTELRMDIPTGYREIERVLSEIDVLWVAPGRDEIEGLFEVEHSTPVYSALLRFNDVLLSDPKVTRFTVVSNDSRRALFSRQLFRPTFRRSGLSELTSFLEYANVVDWHERLRRSDRP